MDQVIQAARELGKTIQADERYIRFHTAQKDSDNDQELQKMIGTFNNMRMELNTELQKTDKDTDAIKRMDGEIKALYQEIFNNENMIRFTEARNELESMVNFVNQIVNGSTNGQNPETIEFEESCGGSCDGCAGCS